MLNILSENYNNIKTLEYGAGLFYKNNMTSWDENLSNLKGGDNMFLQCNKMTSFTSDLSNLVSGISMFKNCTSLINLDIKSLTNLEIGTDMFRNTRLFSFKYDLSNLKNGDGMFNGSSIETFIGDLSSLETGNGMFNGCDLTAASVECICYTLPKVSNNPTITLGINIKYSSSTDELPTLLDDFAVEAGYDSWADLKGQFIIKGWNAKFLYGGSSSIIPTLSNSDNQVSIPFYAKLEEVSINSERDKENAQFCSEDGSKYFNLDIIHDGCDLTGYQYFGSLLEACGYYGIIPKEYLEEQA